MEGEEYPVSHLGPIDTFLLPDLCRSKNTLEHKPKNDTRYDIDMWSKTGLPHTSDQLVRITARQDAEFEAKFKNKRVIPIHAPKPVYNNDWEFPDDNTLDHMHVNEATALVYGALVDMKEDGNVK